MTPVFLDTVDLLALWDEFDQWHAAAEPVFLDLLSAKRDLVTTPLVLLESGNASARRTYRADVCCLRGALLASGRLIEPSTAEIETAWHEFEASAAGEPGIVDLVSFAVMRRLRITQAFTNDRHFVAAGFEVLF